MAGRFGFLKSKTFWVVGGTVETICSLIAYDKWRLNQIRTEFMERAKAAGEVPIGENENLRKMTVITSADEAWKLQKIRKNWKEYAVGLLTAAGIDYQLMEVQIWRLNKELDDSLPVLDGTLPEKDKAPPKVINTKNWIKWTLNYWIDRVNGKSEKTIPSNLSIEEQNAYEFWQKRHVEILNNRILNDGIVALDQETMNVASECPLNENTLHYIPCDPNNRWYQSVYQYFRKAEMAQKIGSAVMSIIESDHVRNK